MTARRTLDSRRSSIAPSPRQYNSRSHEAKSPSESQDAVEPGGHKACSYACEKQNHASHPERAARLNSNHEQCDAVCLAPEQCHRPKGNDTILHGEIYQHKYRKYHAEHDARIPVYECLAPGWSAS